MASFALGLPFHLGGDLTDTLYIYPRIARTGQSISMSAGFMSLLNTLHDDQFTTNPANSLKWSTSTSGPATTSLSDNMVVALDTTAAVASYALVSTSTYAAIDARWSISILNDVASDSGTGEIVYGAMSVYESAGSGLVLSMERIRTAAGVQAIRVRAYKPSVGYTYNVTIPDVSTDCTFRIVRSGANDVAYIYNGAHLATIRAESTSSMSVSLATSATNHKTRVAVRYAAFEARCVAIVNGTLAIDTTHSSFDLMSLVVPECSETGSVIIYDEFGLLAQTTGLTVPSTTGARLSSESSMLATIQNDSVLR